MNTELQKSKDKQKINVYRGNRRGKCIILISKGNENFRNSGKYRFRQRWNICII
jgi:hypothetical protein